jgi:hypothetical protein
MKPHVKVFSLPYFELSTEGLGIDPDKFEYTSKRLLYEAAEEDEVFRKREIGGCWHGVRGSAVDLIAEAAEGSKDPFDLVERLCETSPGNCRDVKELVRQNFDEDEVLEEGVDKLCGVDGFLENREGKVFEYPSFEFKALTGEEGEMYLERLEPGDEMALRWGGHFILMDCEGRDGALPWAVEVESVTSVEDREVTDLLNWHNLAASPKCEGPVVVLPDKTVWRGEKTTKREVPGVYTKVALFTWD